MAEPQYCVVYVTCGGQSEAAHIAEAVVGEKLAACVNIVPSVTSVYYWENQVNHDTECLLIMKTSTARLPALEERVKALHSYTVPEFIALPVLAGSQAYLDWVARNTTAL